MKGGGLFAVSKLDVAESDGGVDDAERLLVADDVFLEVIDGAGGGLTVRICW